MKATLICAVVTFMMFSTIASQPTHDFHQVDECGCQEELDELRYQIVLLNEKVNSILHSGKTENVSTLPSVSPTPATGLFKAYHHGVFSTPTPHFRAIR